MSLVEPFADGAQELEGLSLVVGIVLADTLEACGYPEVRLKWPNDLLLDNRKLAGILIEIAGDNWCGYQRVDAARIWRRH